MQATLTRYARPLQVLHWCVALAVIAQLALAVVLTQLRSLSFGQHLLFLHQQLGLAVLGMVLARGVLGRFVKTPGAVAGVPTWQHRAAIVLHAGFLLLLLAQPLIGIGTAWARGESLSLFGLVSIGSPFEIPEGYYEPLMRTHIVVAALIFGLVAVHLGAVVFNRLIRHVSVLDRMLPPLRTAELRNRMPIGVQLTLAFSFVLAIGMSSGIFAISKYREVTRLQSVLQNGDAAAMDSARAAQIPWKELLGAVAAGSAAKADDAHLVELADAARASVEQAAGQTTQSEVRTALTQLAGSMQAAAPENGAWSLATLKGIDAELQEHNESLSAALFQARTEYDEHAARGHDLVVVALLPMLLAAAGVAVLLARSIAGSLARMQALVQTVTAGDLHANLQVTGSGEFSLLMRDMLAMGTAVERRTADAATGQRALEMERAQLLETAREREAAERAREAAARAATDERERQERERSAELLREMRERETVARLESAAKERQEREANRRALAQEFETQVASLVEAATATVSELKATADEMTSIAGSSVQRSREASTAARQTNDTASAIAAGADQLSGAATAVRTQAERSRAGALIAVEEATEARTLMEGLISSVREIRNITDLIAGISRQSEMLGINARIEAARAGEAGRGFAVVATDVKELASRTRAATTSIESQIAGVSNAAERSAEFLLRIGSRIEELGSLASAILKSADAQCQSTGEIAERMAGVSHSTQAVVSNVEDAQGKAAATADLSTAVQDAAERMEQQTWRMQERVSEFVLAIQSGATRSTPEEAPAAGQRRLAAG